MHTSTPIKEAVHSSLQQSTREKPLIRAFDLVNLGIDFESYRGEVWSNSWDMEEARTGSGQGTRRGADG